MSKLLKLFTLLLLISRIHVIAQDKSILRSKDLPKNAMWLESLSLKYLSQEWGSPQISKSVDSNPLKLKGITYPHGIGTHARSEFMIDLKGICTRFISMAGVDDEVKKNGSVQFEVWLDEKQVFKSGILKGNEEPEPVDINLTDAKIMTLIVNDADDNINYDHADWAGAIIFLKPNASVEPVAINVVDESTPEIFMGEKPEPSINGASVIGTSPGKPFLYLLPISGKGPFKLSAENLPEGLSLNIEKGIITGSIKKEGKYIITIKALSPAGESKKDITIIAGKNKLAQTPPMGWNSWNVWGLEVNDKKVRDAADWLLKSGLAAHGFQYINIDDGWELERDKNGKILTNGKFPDMKALSEYVHSKGLKLGIYSSPGPKTCGGYEGSYKHEEQDANTYAEWGIDYLKYDWCSYGSIAKDQSLDELKKPYVIMRDALEKCDRDIVYSLCQYGMGDVSQWGEEVNGNLWRTTGDITDSWSSLQGIGFKQNGLEKFAGPGHWNDPDMLVVGKLGWGENIHDTRLSKNEQVTHITLWSILSAPLLIGCDLTRIDDFTKALLTNDEVLQVNQDPLGKQGKRIAMDGKMEIWAKELFDGSFAVGLCNRGHKDGKIKFNFSDIGLKDTNIIRDLWKKKDLGEFMNSFESVVNAHGAVFIKISK